MIAPRLPFDLGRAFDLVLAIANIWLASMRGGARRRALSLVGVLVLSCVPPSEPVAPNVTPASTLNIAARDESRPLPFSIAHVSPQGPTSGDPAVFVVFSRSARPLGPDAPVPQGLSISPQVEGHWEWVGSHALSFVPDAGRLPWATSFEVKVPAGIESASGETLKKGRTFQFQSPLPQVTGMSPPRWERSAGPNTPIVLTFSQPMDPKQLDSFLTVSSKEGAIPITLALGNSDREVRAEAEEGWPLNSTISARLEPGWRAKEGPLPAKVRFEGSFETYGPLTATVECHRNETGRCYPGGSLTLRFSNPVPARAAARAIRAEGATLRIDQQWAPDAKTRYVNLGVGLTPRQKFTVIVDPILDIYRQPLQWIKNRHVEVTDYLPTVRVGFSGDSFLPEQKQIAIHARNSGYELAYAALTPKSLSALTRVDAKDRFAFLAKLPDAQTLRVSRGKLNVWERRPLSLDEITAQGLFAVGVRYPGQEYEETEVRWGQRTDLAVTAKSGRDRADAWVTRLSTGKPVSGASVRVTDSSASVKTDDSGLVKLAEGEFLSRAGKPDEPEWLEVRLGNEVAYRSSDESIDAWRLPVPVDFWSPEKDLSMLFPERDLFRPGQSAWVKGYVRRPVTTGTAPVKNQQLQLELVSPTNEVTQSLQVRTNEYGAVSERLHIPASAQLGYWSLRLRRAEETLSSTGIQVAEYRPSEFEVEVRSSVTGVVAGEPVPWEVQGSYFYGGVMAEAPVEVSLRRERTWFSPPGFDSHISDDSEWQRLEEYRPYSTFLESEKAKLSTAGRLTKTTASQLEKQVGPERLEFEATVTDLSAQTVSARASVLVHPAAYYPVFERLESSLLDAPATLNPKVLAVTPEGKVLPDRSLALKLYRVRWTHAKAPGSGGASGTIRQPVRDLVEQCTVKTAHSAQSCALRVPYSGEYIVRATATDKSGRSVSSSLGFYALGGGGQAAWRDLSERGVVELSADREMYSPGQTARILVQSPFQKARAWVTVERNGVLEQRIETLSGPSPSIYVPITKEMMPNAYVGVHLIEDRASAGAKAHAIAESYRLGYVQLRLDPEKRRLSVDVTTDKTSYRPRDEVKLDLAVKDSQGGARRSEVAVFVIDEGVLSLSGYEMPDPLATFLQPRPLRVETIESRESMARVFGFDPNAQENKGDPGGGGDGERSNMLTAAYFNPSVVTDERGRAQVQFALPDNIGRFRVMAVAVSVDDYFGKGKGEITVNQPLMVRPALPRFLRAGDRFEAAATISGLDLPAGAVQVKAELGGAQLLSNAEKSVSLGDTGGAPVSFDARVDQVGEATFLFSAQSGQHRDAVRLARPVRTPAQLEAVALYGKTSQAEGHRLGLLADVRKDMGQLDVTMSSSALVGLEGGFAQLWDYPYLCSEQLASRALPLLMLRDFAALYGVQAPQDADRRIEENVGQLIRRQRGDGGFGMWPESPHSSPWVSTYALWVLGEAQERGVTVPKTTFERGLRYLRDLSGGRKDEELTGAAFALFVMGRLGHPDPHGVMALYEHVERMPVEAQFLLSWAASQSDDEDRLQSYQKALLRRVEGAITLRGNAAEITAPHGAQAGVTMASDTRRHALALLALLSARPEHELAAPLVRSLLDARDGQGWESTQAAAFALLSLDAYRRAQEKEEPNFEGLVFLGDQLLGRKRFLGRSVKAQDFAVEMKELVAGGDLIFQQKGSGTLFYEARLKYARKELPKEPLESGFSVHKTMMSVSPHPLDETPETVQDERQVARGDLVLVQVVVVSPTRRRFVVIDDPLPAGLEAIDPSLRIAQGSLRTLLERGASGYQSAWYRSELRDDRVLYFVDDMPPGVYRYRYLARATTAGEFVTPPTRALEMYQPEVYGRTAARSYEVSR